MARARAAARRIVRGLRPCLKSSIRCRASASGWPAITAWSARRSCAASRAKIARSITVDRSEVDLIRQAEVEAWLEHSAARRDRPGGGEGRRHPRQRHVSGRVPLRQPDDRGERDRGGPSRRRRPPAVPRLVLHLSASSRPSRSPRTRCSPGPLEPTNEWYAIAKIAGIKLCQAYRKQYGRDFISAMPTNLYGPGDNFDLDHQPRAAGADPQGARGQASGGCRD